MLDKDFKEFSSCILEITKFIKKNFGIGDYLKMKSEGLISNQQYGIKGEFPITGYSFHGYGCGFQFKTFQVDIEFDDNIIGFTAWSFYSYVNKTEKQITENDVNSFLSQKIEKEELKYSGKVYYW